ncbi:MAG: NUDIX hydrolase [Oscillospiraceae bacterium]
MSHFEKTISESTIYTGKIFTIKERTALLEDGTPAKRELIFHHGGAAVLPIDENGDVYLIKQFRSPFQCEVLEIPAGKLEQGEDPFEAAKRELSEETGFSALEYTNLGEMWPTVGYCSEKIYIYLAQKLSLGEISPDEDEFISTIKMPFEKALSLCFDGTIKDGKTLVALLKAKDFLNK